MASWSTNCPEIKRESSSTSKRCPTSFAPKTCTGQSLEHPGLSTKSAASQPIRDIDPTSALFDPKFNWQGHKSETSAGTGIPWYKKPRRKKPYRGPLKWGKDKKDG